MLQANLNKNVKFIAIKCFDIPNLSDYKHINEFNINVQNNPYYQNKDTNS